MLLYNAGASVSSSVERLLCHICRCQGKFLEFNEVITCMSTKAEHLSQGRGLCVP